MILKSLAVFQIKYLTILLIPKSHLCKTMAQNKITAFFNKKILSENDNDRAISFTRSSPVKKLKKDVVEDKNGIKPISIIGENSSPLNTKYIKNIDEYNPNVSNYDITSDAVWESGQKIPYAALARTLEEIEKESSRLKIISILSNYFKSTIALSPFDLLPSLYLCLNIIAPAYEGKELGIGESVIIKMIGEATGRNINAIKQDLNVKGDLGLVAESSKSNQSTMVKPPRLTVDKVFKTFKEISQISGNSSTTLKLQKIKSLFITCQNSEARYMIRFVLGKMRIGLAQQSVIAALAQAFTPNEKGTAEAIKKKVDENTQILKSAFSECPSFDLIIPHILKDGIANLPDFCKIQPGIPVEPMLAQPTKGIQELFKKFDNTELTFEWKYDGERAQIHLGDSGEMYVYSRNQENTTSKYPDLVARMKCGVYDENEVKSFVLDTETVAWDPVKQQILPFQVLSTRKRKDAVESEIKIQVCVFAFDLLYLNGKSLVKMPLVKRRELMVSHFVPTRGSFEFARHVDNPRDPDFVSEFLEEAVKGNCEGLMVKTLNANSTYEIAKRSNNWLKLKKDYLDNLGDTMDLVIIGGYSGKGKRTGVYGGLLLACYDPENEEYQSICKLGTGFKDEDLEELNEKLSQVKIKGPKSYYAFDNSLDQPNDWFEPQYVCEVKAADLSISPVHKAAIGLVDAHKGISLRFPRYLKLREDKKPEDATTSSQIADFYNQQEQIKNKADRNVKDTAKDDQDED